MAKLHVTTTQVVDLDNNRGTTLSVPWDAALSLSREYYRYDGGADTPYTYAKVTVVDPSNGEKMVFQYHGD